MCILLVIAMSSIALAAEDPVWPDSPHNNVRHKRCVMWPYICIVHVFSVFWIGAVLDFLLTIVFDNTLTLLGAKQKFDQKMVIFSFWAGATLF